MEISAAAPPPTPLKTATICGIAVIFTKRAAGTAMAAPSTMAMIASTRFQPECRSDGRVKVMPMARVGRRGADQVRRGGRAGASSGP